MCQSHITDWQTVPQLHSILHCANLTELPISQSWRFGAPLSGAATSVLNHFKAPLPSFEPVQVRGDPARTTRLIACTASAPPYATAEAGQQLVVLARKNTTILAEAAAATSHGLRLWFNKGSAFSFIEGGARRLLDMRLLCLGLQVQPDCKDPSLLGFANKGYKQGTERGWSGYKKRLDKSRDVALITYCHFVEEHKNDLPQIVTSIQAATVCQQSDADVLYLTAHKAKGLGFPRVYLCDDFLGGCTPDELIMEKQMKALARGLPDPTALLEDTPWMLLGDDVEGEINLLYVALTRAMEKLYVGATLCEWFRLAGVPLEGAVVVGEAVAAGAEAAGASAADPAAAAATATGSAAAGAAAADAAGAAAADAAGAAGAAAAVLPVVGVQAVGQASAAGGGAGG